MVAPLGGMPRLPAARRYVESYPSRRCARPCAWPRSVARHGLQAARSIETQATDPLRVLPLQVQPSIPRANNDATLAVLEKVLEGDGGVNDDASGLTTLAELEQLLEGEGDVPPQQTGQRMEWPFEPGMSVRDQLFEIRRTSPGVVNYNADPLLNQVLRSYGTLMVRAELTSTLIRIPELSRRGRDEVFYISLQARPLQAPLLVRATKEQMKSMEDHFQPYLDEVQAALDTEIAEIAEAESLASAAVNLFAELNVAAVDGSESEPLPPLPGSGGAGFHYTESAPQAALPLLQAEFAEWMTPLSGDEPEQGGSRQGSIYAAAAPGAVVQGASEAEWPPLPLEDWLTDNANDELDQDGSGQGSTYGGAASGGVARGASKVGGGANGTLPRCLTSLF